MFRALSRVWGVFTANQVLTHAARAAAKQLNFQPLCGRARRARRALIRARGVGRFAFGAVFGKTPRALCRLITYWPAARSICISGAGPEIRDAHRPSKSSGHELRPWARALGMRHDNSKIVSRSTLRPNYMFLILGRFAFGKMPRGPRAARGRPGNRQHLDLQSDSVILQSGNS